MLDALVFRHHDGQAPLDQQTPNKPSLAPISDLNDRALRSSAVIGPGAPDQCPITMHRLLHLSRRQKEIGPTGIRYEKTETVTMTGDPPGHQLEARRQQEHSLAIGQQLTIALHCKNPFLEDREVSRGHTETVGNFLRRQRRVGNAKRFKDFFARRRNPGFSHDLTELMVGLYFLARVTTVTSKPRWRNW